MPGKYDDAIEILEDIVDDNPKNADAWNLMGYSHRKLGEYDDALEYYGKALKLKPNHVGANEYLGELYLEMKDLPKAEERLAVLTKACNGCEEQKELEEKIADYKANNAEARHPGPIPQSRLLTLASRRSPRGSRVNSFQGRASTVR